MICHNPRKGELTEATLMKILIAEDEESISAIYEIALRSEGHEVTLTNNGLKCLQEYQSKCSSNESNLPYDAVVLDYRMPIMDGFETAKQILKIRPDQRIIFASAYAKETLTALIKNLGIVAELLQKPFEIDTLVETIEDRYIYTKLQNLRIDIGDLESWNPTHKQLSDLLDALLRLKDPKAVFDELLPNRAKDDDSDLKQYQKKTRDNDSEIIIAIIEDALKFLGPEWLSIFYYHLAKLGIEKDNIARNTQGFIKALNGVLGTGSAIICAKILSTIEKNQDLIDGNESVANFAQALKQIEYVPNKNREMNKIDA
jgi:CheY-like chemotaxis protein